MKHLLIPWLILAVTLVSRAAAEHADPFSIVSMTLHDEALARAHDVALAGDLAFVPGKGQSLSIIDVSDPAQPEILWYKNDEEIPDAETVLPMDDHHLLLGTRDFLTLDFSDPRKPVILGVVTDRPRVDKINGMILIGDHALAANKTGYVDAFDVSDLSRPVLFGALETREQFGLQYPHDIDRLGDDFVVVVDPNRFEPPAGRLGVFRVAQEGRVLPVEQWTMVGRLEDKALVGANRVQVTGHYAGVGGSFSPEGRAAAEKESGGAITAHLTVIDLSDPTAPKRVAELPFNDLRGPNGLTIAGQVVFCAGGQTVAAYDLSDPENPALLAEQHFPIYREAERKDNYHDLVYRDGLLYVSAQSDHGFLILKVEDPRIRELADQK